MFLDCVLRVVEQHDVNMCVLHVVRDVGGGGEGMMG